MKLFHTDRARTGKGRKRRAAIGVLATATLASVLGLAPAAHAATLPVACDEESLIDRIEQANLTVAADTLILAKNCTYEFEEAYFDEGTMVLTDNALPVITEDLTIVGRGSKIVRDVDEEDSEDENFSPFRHLEIAGATVVINDVTFSGGLISFPGVPASTTLIAGSILSTGGDLTLNRVKVVDNEVFAFAGAATITTAGGGIVVDGATLTLNRSTVADNEVTGISAGVVGASGGVLADVTVMRNSKITHNAVNIASSLVGDIGLGGGLTTGDLDMRKSSVTKNSIDATTSGILNINAGGGIVLVGLGDIRESDVSGNRVEAEGGLITLAAGGGIFNLGDLFVDDPDLGADDDGRTTVNNNTASCEGTCAALGGGYANSEGLGLLGLGFAEFNNTLFKGNVASASDGVGIGGGLFLDGDGAAGSVETTLIDSTVTKNTAKGDVFQAGGGIYATADAEVDLDDSRVFKNKPDDCFGAAVFGLCDD